MLDPDSIHNWKEDFGHENGYYYNACAKCDIVFLGHKRRNICKVCGDKAAQGWRQMTPEEQKEILTNIRKQIISFYDNH